MKIGSKCSQTRIFSRGIAGNFDWRLGRAESYTPGKRMPLVTRAKGFHIFKPRNEKINAKEINAV